MLIVSHNKIKKINNYEQQNFSKNNYYSPDFPFLTVNVGIFLGSPKYKFNFLNLQINEEYFYIQISKFLRKIISQK